MVYVYRPEGQLLYVPNAPQGSFEYQGHHWQFKVLPFGLYLSLRVFTRCMTAAPVPLQSQGMTILPNLDNWLIHAPSQDQAAQDTAPLLSHVFQLGLKVTWSKAASAPLKLQHSLV